MAVDPKALFLRARSLWPDKIDLGRRPVSGLVVEGGQILIDLYEAIDASVDVEDEWLQLAAWAFHQALWGANKRTTRPDGFLYTADVSFSDFDDFVKFNLSNDSWAAIRAEYLEGK